MTRKRQNIPRYEHEDTGWHWVWVESEDHSFGG